MSKPPNTMVLTPPEAGPEFALARRIHNTRSGLEEGILDRLAGRPQRYADLQPLLGGRNTNVLNKALKRLADEGLLEQYGSPREPRAVRYQLTSLGVAARDAIVEMRFAERVHAAAGEAEASAA